MDCSLTSLIRVVSLLWIIGANSWADTLHAPDGKHLNIEQQGIKQACPVLKLAGGEWLSWTDLMATPSGTGNSLRLIKLIRENLPLTIQETGAAPFTRQLRQLQDSHVDVMFGLYPTGDRLKNFEFTDSFFLEALYVYSAKELAEKEWRLEDLKHYRGIAVRGSSYGEDINTLINTHPKQWTMVGRYIQAITMVAAGRADFLIGSKVSSDLKKTEASVYRSAKPVAWQPVAAAFTKNSPCAGWIPAINHLIQQHMQGFVKPESQQH